LIVAIRFDVYSEILNTKDIEITYITQI
jgi:hypothetical protein